MSNQDILFDWWWSQNGPRKEGPQSICEISTLLDVARQAEVVRGKNGGPITEAGWNYAVLKFLIEYCTPSSEVHRELKAFAHPPVNYAGWKNFRDRPARTTRLSAQTQAHEPCVASPNEKLPDVNAPVSLQDLIADLQSAIKNEGIEYGTLKKAVADLSRLGYQYDHALFPDLENTENYTDSIGESPSSLAEALLWKLGKWKSYKKFTTYYMDDSLTPTQTDVVFYAFAKHLKDRSNPI